MAWVTGTASDHIDLMNRLATFLSTDTNLVAAGQNWTVLRQSVLPFSSTFAGGNISFGNSTNAIITNAWPAVVPTTNCRMKFSGTLAAPSAGSYTFGVKACRMCEVWIDGALAYGQYAADTFNTTWTNQFTTTLTAGNHAFEVRYIGFTDTTNFLTIGWKKPGDGAVAVIPAASFTGLTLTWNALYGNNTGNGNSAAAFAAAFGQQEIVVRGPGLSGADQVFVGLANYVDASGDLYNITLRGLTGYNAALTMDGQPGQVVPPAANVMTTILAWNQPMKYWFIANGRRFIIVAKVSTVYESAYAGFILPYALPSEVPYPIAIGAPATFQNIRWSEQTGKHGSPWRPTSDTSNRSNLLYRNVGGAWEWYGNYADSGTPSGKVYPTGAATPAQTRPDPSGSYALTPLVLYTTDNGKNVHGEFDGAFHVSGYTNASENIITISGQDYLVVQGGYRTTNVDYAAIALQ